MICNEGTDFKTAFFPSHQISAFVPHTEDLNPASQTWSQQIRVAVIIEI